tara:strand:+ start:2836 stop:3087 length:252 start_codon:yes stop_codon:yes gene_type:complete
MTTINQDKDNSMETRIMELLNEIKELNDNKKTERWLCIKDVCRYTSMSDSTIRRAVKRGTLKASHSTGKLLFKVSSVDRWLNG